MGQTVGILPGEIYSSAYQYIDTAIPNREGIGRNIIIVRTADIIIAAGGGAGTLSEIALAWQLGYSVQTDHLFPRQIDHLFSSDNLVQICR